LCACSQALVLDATPRDFVLSQEIQGKSADDGEIPGGEPRTDAARGLVEGFFPIALLRNKGTHTVWVNFCKAIVTNYL